MIFLTWHPQHLLLSLLTTLSATRQSKAWRMVPAYSATSTTLTNAVISGKWIQINWSAGYYLLPDTSPFHFPYQLCDVQVKTMEAQKDLGVFVTKHPKWSSWLSVQIRFRHSWPASSQATLPVITSHIARRCGLLKLLILSLTSKEFSDAQQKSFCLCRIGLTLVTSGDFYRDRNYYLDLA